ncbi:MAG: hypothetical protein JWL69_5061 [Phycisphaerales bacterium]|nr:hypothetical protein [Phycisphaerales bacterium]
MDSTKKAVDAATKLVEILGGLDSEQRSRAISAAMVLLGEPTQGLMEPTNGRTQIAPSDDVKGLSSKALAWARKSGISTDQLQHVFAIEPDGVEVIAGRAPGKSKRLQTIESYLICGLKSFVASGDPSFTDEDARAVCKSLGAFDSPNHFNYVKGLGNLATGSKDAGWKLTNPGLTRAADIVKQLVPLSAD